eukprot:GEMP01029565.1.p1 GENE.GEMP01029565.1~~GEMP01029565.1.p1  ORF type:complete len:346 (+),score=86.56 GEMP01029565.1:159-1196(+)
MSLTTAGDNCRCDLVLVLLISTVVLVCFCMILILIISFLLYTRRRSVDEKTSKTDSSKKKVRPGGSPRQADREKSSKAEKGSARSPHNERDGAGNATPTKKELAALKKQRSKTNVAGSEKRRDTKDSADGKPARLRSTSLGSLPSVNSPHNKNSPNLKRTATSPVVGAGAKDVNSCSDSLSSDSGERKPAWRQKRYSPRYRRPWQQHQKQQPRQRGDVNDSEWAAKKAPGANVNPVGPIMNSQTIPKNVPRTTDADDADKKKRERDPDAPVFPQKLLLMGGPFLLGEGEDRRKENEQKKKGGDFARRPKEVNIGGRNQDTGKWGNNGGKYQDGGKDVKNDGKYQD